MLTNKVKDPEVRSSTERMPPSSIQLSLNSHFKYSTNGLALPYVFCRKKIYSIEDNPKNLSVLKVAANG